MRFSLIEDWGNEKGSLIYGYERAVSLLYSIRAKEFEIEQVISEPFFDPTTKVRGAVHLKLCRLRERLVCRAARIR